MLADFGGAEAVARELQQLREKVENLSSLIEVSIIINSTVELDQLVNLVMEKAQSVMQAEASSVMLFNEKTQCLDCRFALGEVGDQVREVMRLKMGEGVAGWVAEHREPQIVPDVSKDPRFTSKVDESTGFRTRSILAAPLLVQDRLIGVAEVINRKDGREFTRDDLELFSTFCRQVAMAIENVRMYRVELEKQKLEQQLEAAKHIQQSFMPESFPSPEDGAYAVAARSLPAVSIGGDLYDWIDFDDHQVGVAVGDVTGKGVPAALYMARLVSDFRTYAQMYKLPSRVLMALNNVLVERGRRGMFVTFQYGILDPASGLFRYANAGHIPIIRVARDGDAQMVEKTGNVPLGILPEVEFREGTVQLEPGDVLIMITDGIIDARNAQGEAYSLERALTFCGSHRGPVQELVDALIADVQAFTGDQVQFDDLTVLALSWH